MTRVLASTKIRTTKRTRLRWSVRWEAKLPDLWLGAFWTSTTGPSGRWAVLDVWVCILPCLPIHFFFNRAPSGW